MSLSYLFLLFIVYSVIGWVCEVAYCSIIEKKFVNRGFLMGPLCPVYGFGAILVIFLLKPFSGNVFYLFTMAVVVTSTLEYATGWALETIFRTKWWDYSQYRFNIHGRVCLLNSLIFGAMGVAGVLFVHPAVTFSLSFIPDDSIDAIALALAAILAVDIALTLRALVDLREKLSGLANFLESVKESIDVREWFNELDLSGSLERLRARANIDPSGAIHKMAARFEGLIRNPIGVARLFSAFPTLKKALAPRAESPAESAGAAGAAAAGTATVVDSKKISVGAFDYLWVFLLASFIGVVLETIWCVATTGSLQSRSGLLYGMLNPVYGAGAVLMTAALSRLEKKRDISVFFGSMLIGAGFEYLCSLGQELAFGSISWEYSHTQLNLHGRTNLMFALIWGVLGLLWIREMLPVILALVGKIPARAGKAIAIVCAALLLVNCAVSAAAVHRWSERKHGYAPANRVEELIDAQYPDDFMARIYPNMTFVR